MVDLSYDGMTLASNPGFTAPRAPRAKMPPAQQLFLRAVFAAETLQRMGAPITVDTVSQELGLAKHATTERENVRLLMLSAPWRAALEERGIHDGAEELSARQMAALAIYMDMTLRRSHKQKLEMAGVTQSEWVGWMRQPRFSQYLADLSAEALQASLPVARQRVAEAVDEGERWAIELMLKMTGNDPDQGVDLQRVLMGIFQILDEEVRDPSIMARIGDKVQRMVGGGQGQELQRQVVQLRPSEPRVYPGADTPAPAFPVQEG